MGARPIFVLGLQRSGTTWIGNLLEAHPEVAAVAAPRHQGIHESLFFSHFARAWDWSRPKQREEAVRAFLSSDYGELMQLHEDEIQQVLRAGSAADSFATAMKVYAWTMNARAWVEKSPHHTRHSEEIARALPEALFVAIHRDTVSLLASRLSAYGRTPPRGVRRCVAILRGAASNAYHRRLVDRQERRIPGRVIRLDFETFRSGGDAAVARLLDMANLSPAPGLKPRFRANSSFREPGGRAKVLSGFDRALARTADCAVALIPGIVLAGIRAATVGRKVVFPAWVWRDAADRPKGIAVAKPRPHEARTLRPAA